jgi:CheY-like chemotaxis protein
MSPIKESVSAVLYPTVLVAEDSTDTRIMLKRAFEIKGYRVFEAEDGQQALDMARRHRPSLLVVDLNMPVMDGLETHQKFRKLEGDGDHTPSWQSRLMTFTAWKKRHRKRLERLSDEAARSRRPRSRLKASALSFDLRG